MSTHGGVRTAEVGFLFMLISGVWFVAAELPAFPFARGRRMVAGVLLAIGALLLIVATHWGHF
jgi:hypothetical protein